jgi:hypothetical protein
MQQPQPSPSVSNHQSGILAFLPATVEHYPHDVDAWTKKVDGGRRERGRGRRRRSRFSSEERAFSAVDRVSLLDWVFEETCDVRRSLVASSTTSRGAMDQVRRVEPRETTILIFFSYDPDQEYSWSVRNRLVRLLMYRDSLRRGSSGRDGVRTRSAGHLPCLRCIAVSGTDLRGIDRPADSPSSLPLKSSSSFLAATGFAAVPWSAQVAFLVPDQTPGVSVYRNQRKISSTHEELGLEWNEPETVLKRWSQGRSALSCSQAVLASVLFPSSCAVL